MLEISQIIKKYIKSDILNYYNSWSASPFTISLNVGSFFKLFYSVDLLLTYFFCPSEEKNAILFKEFPNLTNPGS